VLAVVFLMAVQGCRHADDVDPQTERLVERMQTAYKGGDWTEALALADSVRERAPQRPEAPLTEGLVLTSLKRYDEAEAAYERALALDPTVRKAWYHLGHNAFLQRRYREALSYYRKEQGLLEKTNRGVRSAEAPSESEDLAAISAQIGRTYALLGVEDSARIAYEEALELDQTHAAAHAWLSELYESQGRLDDALRHAQEALESKPEEVGYAYRVGFLLFQTGRAEEAAMLLSAVVQRWPGHEGASYNLGRALKAIGREREGQTMLERVEEIQKLQEQALLAQRAVEMYPDDARRWVDLARLMMQIGYHDKAEEALTAALAQQPGNLSIQHDLANLAMVRGDTTVALERFQSLIRKDSTLADAWLNLGIIYAMTGRKSEARAAWQKVLHIDPDDPDARKYLSRLDR